MAHIDDELAEVTDALMDGREMRRLDGENGDLQDVVRQIFNLIDPLTPPSTAFQRRMMERLNAEWSRSYAPPVLRLMDRPLVRVTSLAAAVVLVLGALIVLAVPNTAEQLQGAAIAIDDAAALVVLAVVAVVGAIFYWRSRS